MRKHLIAAMSLLVIANSTTFACNVPVFRYGLERWPADAYEAVVFHHGELTAPQQEIVTALTRAGEQSANLVVATVDTAKEIPEPWREIWKPLTNSTLPVMTLRYPSVGKPMNSWWSGPLSIETARALVDSPARRELAKRLLTGHSAVWVVLDGDDALMTRLDGELRKMEKELALPEPAPDDPQISNDVPLGIKFSTLRVSRADPSEAMFVRMLVGADSSFATEKGPLVFPVFGRGRALAGLTAENLTADTIVQIASFLCGACSCEVKSLNPGFDLLVAADWDAGLNGQVVKDPPLPPLVSLSTLAGTATKPALPSPPSPPPPAAHPLLQNLVIAVAIALIVIVGLTVWLKRQP